MAGGRPPVYLQLTAPNQSQTTARKNAEGPKYAGLNPRAPLHWLDLLFHGPKAAANAALVNWANLTHGPMARP